MAKGKYSYRTKPFKHQRKALNLSWDKEAFALFMEQGTGKTKILLDNAAFLSERKEIDGLLVVADNGIHHNWLADEVPAHWPTRIPFNSFVWRSGKVSTKRHEAALDKLLNSREFAILAMNIDAVITNNGARTLQQFLKKRQCMIVVDESTSIKTPKAKRTRAIVNMRKLAPYRRIATGTPVAEGPFNLYSPFMFLDPTIIGINSFYAFKHYYGIWENARAGGPKGHQYEVLKEYMNLDQLMNRIDPFSFRVLKKDCMDLPPKLYQKRYFDLSKEQRELYNRLREDYILELRQENAAKIVPLALTRILRCQQIACGHVPAANDDEPAVSLKDNARLECLKQTVEDLPSDAQAIIWARFKPDIDQICELLGREAVRYDGRVDDEERAKNKKKFQDGGARFLVGNQKAGGKGLTLTAASYVIYYSNYFGLETRLQSEDRAHRHGSQQHKAITYIDLVAHDTVDDKKIIPALKGKRKMSDTLTGDSPEDWL